MLGKLTFIHSKLEDQACDMRDSRISMLGVANGLVVREKDGSPSSIIRIGTRSLVQKVLALSEEYDKNPAAAETWMENHE